MPSSNKQRLRRGAIAAGDAVPDKTFRISFSTDDRRGKANTFLYNNGPVTSINDDNLLFRQNYNLDLIEGNKTTSLVRNGRAAPSNTGPASFPNFGVRCGQCGDPDPAGPRVRRRSQVDLRGA
jgi:hypothetical protein